MDLVEEEIVIRLFEKYEEIHVLNSEPNKILFSLFNKEFCCLYPSKENEAEHFRFFVKNDKTCTHPHVLVSKDDSSEYIPICLYENNDVVNFLLSFEEKAEDSINRLIALYSLSPIEKEKEFQKEFLYYWNKEATNKQQINLFIKPEMIFQKMNLYSFNTNDGRLIWNVVADGTRLNQSSHKDEWQFSRKIDAFYIPISDNRGILPPLQCRPWSEKDIINIIYGKDINRVSEETLNRVKEIKTKHLQTLLVFEMLIEGSSINFSVLITFKHTNKTKKSLLSKLKEDISSIQVMSSHRIDYFHLCRQIGNDTALINKQVLLVGAGSLGSYIGTELVKSGVKNLVVYDFDFLSYENILRHEARCYCVGENKASTLKFELELIHPEIFVKAVNQPINENELLKEIPNVDLIIFAVGSSDVQLIANKILKGLPNCPHVLYTWLEAGGQDSHILVVDYNKAGCFQCLFTDTLGNLTNNKSNRVSDEVLEKNIIRNGCGATRVAYGNTVLLRTAAVLLEVVRDIFNEQFENNALIDITPRRVYDRGEEFVEGKCQCCGDRDNG